MVLFEAPAGVEDAAAAAVVDEASFETGFVGEVRLAVTLGFLTRHFDAGVLP